VTTRITPLPRQRRHTLHFLAGLRGMVPVFLDTEVDMTRVLAHRAAASRRYSVIGYLTCVAGQVLAAHPAANVAVSGRLRPRVATYPGVHAKLTFDATVDGERIVLSAVLADVHTTDLDGVQDRIDGLRDGDPAVLPDYAGARLLQRLPVALGRVLYLAGTRPLKGRGPRLGTLAITSLGHRPVDGFHSLGGTTMTLGAGHIAERPVVRDGAVATAPLMRLNLTFDHRVIDGAAAADVLAALRTGLENYR
jgi:pyruvate/2-oxoglutarate dehydrogenase complex dihydrolipoamide acyltransferase (E2) component